ncbi:MAG: hypothetical protein DHS20C11_19800 [Lysobacteraceae bacterium]|nr:MAG: hypothetical protein DHS20C11_19800 [Xanthomonadaceae bacterium]
MSNIQRHCQHITGIGACGRQGLGDGQRRLNDGDIRCVVAGRQAARAIGVIPTPAGIVVAVVAARIAIPIQNSGARHHSDGLGGCIVDAGIADRAKIQSQLTVQLM